jgi:hypothetical protein
MTSNRIWMSILCSVILQTSLAAQSGPANDEGSTTVLARLSYMNTYPAVSGQQRSPGICFELYRSGRYRVSRMIDGATRTLGGALTQDQLAAVTQLMKKLDFKNSGGGVIRSGSESFVAEIVRGNETMRYLWVDPDHQRPLPDSAVTIISWLQGFVPQDASPITVPELSTDPICPRVSVNPVQPVAANTHRISCACLSQNGA